MGAPVAIDQYPQPAKSGAVPSGLAERGCRQDAVRVHAQAGAHDRGETRAREARRRGRFRSPLAVRLARAVARAVRPPGAHRGAHEAPAAGDLALRTRGPGSRPVTASDLAPPQRDQRRADGPRDRTGRLRAARPRKASYDPGPHGGGDQASSASWSRVCPVNYEGTELQLTWLGKWKLPDRVAGYGPWPCR